MHLAGETPCIIKKQFIYFQQKRGIVRYWIILGSLVGFRIELKKSGGKTKLGKNGIYIFSDGFLPSQSTGSDIPWRWTNIRCTVRTTVNRAGRMATCQPKNRVMVAPVTSGEPRMSFRKKSPTTGKAPTIPVPTLVAKKASSFHGRR